MSTFRPCPLYDGASYEITQSVGHQMINVMTMMRREVEVRMAAHGLTDAQWKPLMLLRNGLATTAIELARRMDVDAGAITRLLDRLEAKGLLERLRSTADRRVVHLQLTAAGEAAAAKVPFVLASVNNDFLKGFSEAEWKQLRKLLERMAANAQALQSEEGTPT